MADGHRALPSWMEKKTKENKVTERKEPLKTTRKRKASRALFYCMNEAELVQAAVECLTNGACDDVPPLSDRQVEDRTADTAATIKMEPQKKKRAKSAAKTSDKEDSDFAETTYVSESDFDITEVETLPYAQKSPQHPGPEGQRSGTDRGRGALVDVGPETREETETRSPRPADAAEEDDDALRLVREIFFT